MAPKPLVNGTDYSMADSHEDRIQRLESETSDIKANVAESLVRISTVDGKVDESKKLLMEKMDTMIDVIKIHASDSAARFKDMQASMNQHDDRIKPLEAASMVKKKRTLTLKKISIPLALASAGAVAGKFGEMIWSWISK